MDNFDEKGKAQKKIYLYNKFSENTEMHKKGNDVKFTTHEDLRTVPDDVHT